MEPDRASSSSNVSQCGPEVLERWVRHGGTLREVARGSGMVRLELLTCDGHEAMELLVLESEVWDAWRVAQN